MSDKQDVQGIGQIAIAITNLNQAVDFYQNKLGLTLLFDVPPNLAFFQCGDIRLMLTTLQGDPNDHHTSVIYYKVADIKSFCDDLKTANVSLVREPQLAATMPDHELWMAFIRDPDNNLIGIMSEVPINPAH